MPAEATAKTKESESSSFIFHTEAVLATLAKMNALTMVISLIVSAGGAGLLLQAACGEGCDDIGCEPGATVELAQTLGEPGAYRVTVIADGETTVCTLTVPQRESEDCDGDGAFPLSGGDEAADSNEQGPGTGIAGVFIYGEPLEVEVIVERDEEELLRESVAPHYEDVEHAGEGCGTCRQGTASIANE